MVGAHHSEVTVAAVVGLARTGDGHDHRQGLRSEATVLFNGCFLVIEAHGGTWFRTPCPNCRAELSKVPAAAPQPRKKGRFKGCESEAQARMVRAIPVRTSIIRLPPRL